MSAVYTLDHIISDAARLWHLLDTIEDQLLDTDYGDGPNKEALECTASLVTIASRMAALIRDNAEANHKEIKGIKQLAA